ncbi:MAG: putative phosphoribosyl transferase domain protein [Candidatus Bathyarchaeota archaeon B23]|nr:MAG: putative phosphoribosyl transferase domain protein [Candidatus Bathyarchaeota archaeon B23]
MKVVGGPSSQELGRRVAEALGLPLMETSTKRFPDGEFYFRYLGGVSGEDLLIVQSLYPPQDEHLLELLAMIHAARDLAADSITLYIPYLAYSRQDERYLAGECVTSDLVRSLLEGVGADALYTVDIHSIGVLKRYRIPAYNLTAAGELARYFAEKGLRDPLILAPDDEEMALERVRHAAEVMDAEYDYFRKERDRHTGEIKTYAKELSVGGRDVVIIDDIISTGRTTANAARILKELGAARVYAGVTHLLLRGDALQLIEAAGVEEVVGTDSVPGGLSRVSVAPLIAEALNP